VQFDNNRWAWWVLQDAGGDVVAVCDMNGPGQKARVVGQWRYDAYGAATAAEHVATGGFPQIHCGHKALFFDRLDVGVGDDGAGLRTTLYVAAATSTHGLILSRPMCLARLITAAAGFCAKTRRVA